MRIGSCPAFLAAMVAAVAPFPQPLAAATGSWSTTGPYGGRVYDLGVYEAAPSTLYVAGGGGVFRSVNSGASWQRLDVGLPALLYYNVAAATEAPVVYVSGTDGMYRSGNAGEYWVAVGSIPGTPFIQDIAVRPGHANQVAVATDEGIFVSSDGGGTWSDGGATVGHGFSSVAYLEDGTLYGATTQPDPAFFSDARVLRSVDNGATWSATPAQPNDPVWSWDRPLILASAADPQWLVWSNAVSIQVSTDGGASWSPRHLPCSPDEIALHPSDTSVALIGCDGSGVHITSDFASATPTWVVWDETSGLTVNGVDPVQTSVIALHPAFAGTPTIWIATEDGGLFRSTNGGTSWAAINNGLESKSIRALATHPADSGPGAVILAGNGDAGSTTRAVMKSPDAGASWTLANTGLAADTIRTLVIDPTTVDANPLTTEPFTVYAGGWVYGSPYVERSDGGIYKSVDGGETWTTIDAGIAEVEGRPFMGIVRTIALDPRSCASPPPSGPCPIGSGPLQTLLVGGSGYYAGPGMPYVSARIYRSTDGGANWTPSETGLPLGEEVGGPGSGLDAHTGGVVPIVFDPQDPSTVYAGTFLSYHPPDPATAPAPTIENGVFKSTDGGLTWTHSSNGLPRHFPGGSHLDVLALAISHADPLVIYAGVTNTLASPPTGRIYKSTDGGANWFASDVGVAGQDVRALFVDPMDPDGDTIYAGTGGSSANPGGVYRSTDGGATWNSLSIGLPAYSATALAMPARTPGAPARILAGTNSGVWDFTEAPDEDADGSPSAVEGAILAGDGNGDGQPDAQQSNVASLVMPSAAGAAPRGGSTTVTIELLDVSPCSRLNDSNGRSSDLFPPDPLGDGSSHPLGLVAFSVPACAHARVRVVFHGAHFDDDWTWRNYGPRVPGDSTSFGWYTFAGARRINAGAWELSIDAMRQGNYRDDADDILFVGGPAHLPDLLFDNGFE